MVLLLAFSLKGCAQMRTRRWAWVFLAPALFALIGCSRGSSETQAAPSMDYSYSQNVVYTTPASRPEGEAGYMPPYEPFECAVGRLDTVSVEVFPLIVVRYNGDVVAVRQIIVQACVKRDLDGFMPAVALPFSGQVGYDDVMQFSEPLVLGYLSAGYIEPDAPGVWSYRIYLSSEVVPVKPTPVG